MAYKRGSVVLLPFPFTDQSGVKRRPALVLSADRYNRQRGDLIVAPITSNLSTRQTEDVALVEGDTAGLLKPSVVKGVLGKHKAIRRITLVEWKTLLAAALPVRLQLCH